jgi:hypothetical protein
VWTYEYIHTHARTVCAAEAWIVAAFTSRMDLTSGSNTSVPPYCCSIKVRLPSSPGPPAGGARTPFGPLSLTLSPYIYVYTHIHTYMHTSSPAQCCCLHPPVLCARAAALASERPILPETAQIKNTFHKPIHFISQYMWF